MRSRVVALAVLAMLILACTPSAAPSPPAANVTAGPTIAPPTSVVPTASPSPSASCAERTLAAMNEAQRIGQLFLLGLADDRLGPQEVAAISSRHIGSVWYVEKSAAGVVALRTVGDAVQALATRENTGGVGFFVAANQEGGLIQSLSGGGFSTIPSALDESAVAPATLLASARQWGAELASAGVNLNFAPVLDVVPPGSDAQNEPIGVLRRGYGHDVATVSAHGVAFLQGMQSAGIATTAKHFPGLGNVRGNTDFTSSVVDDVITTDHPDLAAFRAAIAADVPFVMVALATYEKIDAQHLAVFSPAVMRDLLRMRLGFVGVIVSDDLGATAAVANVPPAQRAIDFLAAGGDLIVSKTVGPATAMADALLSRALADPSFRARVDDAALRVLRAKERSALVRC